MIDRLELSGPYGGELLDSQLSLYEVKIKNSPIRFYFKYNKSTNEVYVFEFEIKTSPEKQKATIIKIKRKVSGLKYISKAFIPLLQNQRL